MAIHLRVYHPDDAGFIALRESDGYLDQIFVAPAMQQQGVGTILLNKAKQLSPGGMYLDS